MHRILITGPESSGKSELAQWLAETLGGSWAPEYARTYLTNLPRPYTEDDLVVIARGQLALEDELAAHQPAWLWCDTGPEVVYIWSQVKYGRIHPWIEEQTHTRVYDYTLLCRPDLVWTPDPLREAPDPAVRQQLFGHYEALLQTLGRPYAVVSGQGDDRREAALHALRQWFSAQNLPGLFP